MALTYNRPITIAYGRNRRDTAWQSVGTDINELYERLGRPIRGTETYAEFMRLPRARQDDLKDVGGFVAGSLNGGHRKASAVAGRELVTLDFDTIPAYMTESVIAKVKALGCSSCIYSTRKHTPTTPRLRIVIPLDRTVNPDEYEAIARKLADNIGIEMADSSTFEPSRLMYWPSCCKDTNYIYEVNDAPLASADRILALYDDWHDWTQWPQVPGVTPTHVLAAKQGEPTTKPGIVGLFCRAYGIHEAMDEFIPGLYEPTAQDPNRLTYTHGSCAGGAIVYDGKFMYSHHATDPCGGRLVNAFDLVRIHRFGELDEEADGVPINRLPSFSAMSEFAMNDDRVSTLAAQERAEEALRELQGIPTAMSPNAPVMAPVDVVDAPLDEVIDPSTDAIVSVFQKLDKTAKTGQVKGTIDNVRIILQFDPNLAQKFAYNSFAAQAEVFGKLPWNDDERRRMWSDTDLSGLYWYLEKIYDIKGRGCIDAALDIHMSSHAFNEVQDYLSELIWDGTARLDTLLIDYLGAEDNQYVREATRKIFTAAVARAMVPGEKFDNMLILCGPQGYGKSTLIDRMSRGWFNDSIRTFEGKEASELLQGVWLVEIAELDAFRRTDVARIKQFLSLRADRYRAAYARNISEQPRRCVFFGTCNQMDFLIDTTGNRRFWPIDVGVNQRQAKPWDLTDEDINQLWAEAMMRWRLGEKLMLSEEVEMIARSKQEEHREADVNEGLVQDFVAQKIPVDWDDWSIDRRRDYWAAISRGDTSMTSQYELKERDSVCALEVWCELYGERTSDIKQSDSRSINAILDRTPGWKRDGARRHGAYKVQRGFIRSK